MTQELFNKLEWNRGNTVKLNNGKEYFVKGVKGNGKYLLLYSAEYDTCFVADYRIIDCRTSDYVEPEEVYLEKKREHQEAVQARLEIERLERRQEKERKKLKNLQEQEKAHQEALAKKAEKLQKQADKLAEKKAEREARKTMGVAEPKPVVKAEPVAKPATKPAPVVKPAVKANPAVSTKVVEKTEVSPAAGQPKKKRKRITISHVEKVQIK